MFELTPYKKKFLKYWLKNMFNALKTVILGGICGVLLVLSIFLIYYYVGPWAVLILFALITVGLIAAGMTERELIKEKFEQEKLLHEIKYSKFK
jgi:Flp pilus assembly pilin Flp